MEKKILWGDVLPQKVKEEFSQYPKLLEELLFYRGLTTLSEAQNFLEVDYTQHSFDPFLIKGMEKAVSRILEAVGKNQKIMIYSDYDADGIPGAVILNDFFKKIGFTNFNNYIPSRLKEGYGLHKKAIEKFTADKVEVLITIDCGITNVEEIALAQEKGIAVILTDHHLVGEKLPPAYVILNSKQSDDNYPDDMLAGAGVVYKLVQALIQQGDFNLVEGWEKWLLDMVGLATIADMVPLQKENRVFAKYGLYVLQKTPRVGLVKLFKTIKLKQKNISEDDISFMVAPRMNAASRVADPQIAFDLLATDDILVANALAKQLDKLNQKRKTLVAVAVREAKKKIKARGLKDIVVIGNPAWTLGLSGLIASSLKDYYQRPCFVWGVDEKGAYCGSCRSDTTNLVDLMNLVDEGIFSQCGGHGAAAGFGVVKEKIHFLEEKLLEAVKKVEDQPLHKKVFVDKKLTLEEVNRDNYNLIEKLAPFGAGNPKPLFLFEGIKIQKTKVFGKTQNHLELLFQDRLGRGVRAVEFFSSRIKDKVSLLKDGQLINFLANFEKNTFGGRDEIRLRLVAII